LSHDFCLTWGALNDSAPSIVNVEEAIVNLEEGKLGATPSAAMSASRANRFFAGQMLPRRRRDVPPQFSLAFAASE